MKKAISLILLFTILLSCFVSCNNSGNVPDKPDVDDNPSGTNDNPPATIDVAEVNISQSSLTMVVGDRKAISATVVPSDATNKTLTWSSTNTAIADYVNGEIVALGIGNCVIKATSNNGKVASCMVSVKNKAVLAESVSFPGTTYYMGIGENKYCVLSIKPDVLDSYKGSVTSSDQSVVEASYSQDKEAKVAFLAKKEGTATVTVTMDGGKSASVKIVVVDVGKLVKINMPDLPLYLAKYFTSGKLWSIGRLDDITINLLVIDKNNIEVTITTRITKTYDYQGSMSDNYVGCYMDLYSENDVFCHAEWIAEDGYIVGQSFTHSYSFIAGIDDDMTPREFTIKFRDDK